MFKSEILKALAQIDGDPEVRFGYNYGDRAETTVLGRVEQVETEIGVWSAYHQEYRLVDEDEEVPTDLDDVRSYNDDGTTKSKFREFVVLR